MTAESLAVSNQRLQQSMDPYLAASRNNSDRTHNAINNWDYQAVRGCQWVVDVNGYKTWVCPDLAQQTPRNRRGQVWSLARSVYS